VPAVQRGLAGFGLSEMLREKAGFNFSVLCVPCVAAVLVFFWKSAGVRCSRFSPRV